MRTPRPQDFDPTSKRVIQPEAVDVADVTPLKPKAKLNDQRSETVRPERSVRAVRSEQSERPERSAKREIKRHAFEIYRDQLERLKKLKMATMMSGELVSMSEMVREALDTFLNDKEGKLNDSNDPYG